MLIIILFYIFIIQFYSQITYPLLKLIKLLKKNQEDLFNILKKKDSEIDEYILEGGHIHGLYPLQ